jgi:hypothetical protein
MPPPICANVFKIKGFTCIIYVNNNLAGDLAAVWRALFGVRGRRFLLLVCMLLKKLPKMVFRRMMGPPLETGTVLDAALSGNYCAIAIWCL